VSRSSGLRNSDCPAQHYAHTSNRRGLADSSTAQEQAENLLGGKDTHWEEKGSIDVHNVANYHFSILTACFGVHRLRKLYRNT
jgi:hypothetical protein